MFTHPSSCFMCDSAMLPMSTAAFLGFQLNLAPAGSASVSARMHAAVQALRLGQRVCQLLGWPAPPKLVRLLSAFAFTHKDYTLRAADYLGLPCAVHCAAPYTFTPSAGPTLSD